jgi:hypothetical protein
MKRGNFLFFKPVAGIHKYLKEFRREYRATASRSSRDSEDGDVHTTGYDIFGIACSRSVCQPKLYVFFHPQVITFTLLLKNAFLCWLTTNKVNHENSSAFSLGAVPYTSHYVAMRWRRTGRQRLLTMAEKYSCSQRTRCFLIVSSSKYTVGSELLWYLTHVYKAMSFRCNGLAPSRVKLKSDLLKSRG